MKHRVGCSRTIGRLVCTVALLFAAFFIAGCRGSIGLESIKHKIPETWSGRMLLKLASEPPQSINASFELSGNADAGELALLTPLGTTVAALRWQPGGATLVADGSTREFTSIHLLTQHVTGMAFPVQHLFQWLRGEAPSQSDWQVDLSALAAGKLNVRSTGAGPQTELRIVLDR